MNSIWWQVRSIEASKFDNIENDLSEHLKVLAAKYKTHDDLVDYKLEDYSDMIWRRKKEHEVFYNMRFYALLDRESFELNEFVDLINESQDSISKFRDELINTSGSLFNEKVKKKNHMIQSLLDSYFSNF
ncbi:hypothetical protein C922_05234 [Plasmodium inui San Antonio 1]|uniref:Plasmodium RESA N-terminal domain-containing protein n=1 Tax=Plasmodium inui San Antonio 1 TaxID=1237626 RepID=W7A5L7_9APIC|nr:hypothetical protein C922_05234 [Plasmodium inui San Antonio 1]EUD64384.1 hypothetical protein C922_05234 [Plasmodium inui San Antonio 1]